MVFKKNDLHVIVMLDTRGGAQYIEPHLDYYEDEDIEHIYMLTK